MQGPAAPRPSDPTDAVKVLSDKELVSAATMAIKGMLNDQEAALVLGEFMQRFGEEKLSMLADDVVKGTAETFRDERGKISGPGDGTSDMVPAQIAESGQDVLLSDGEFVVPEPAVTAMGGGNNEAGADKLKKMSDKAVKG